MNLDVNTKLQMMVLVAVVVSNTFAKNALRYAGKSGHHDYDS